MKVLVLGAGAIGGYYGARLLQAGTDVRFLVRQGRHEALAESGLVVHSALGGFRGAVHSMTQFDSSERFDVVVLACKSYDLADAIDAIAPAVERGAVVLPFLNGISVYSDLDREFGREQVMGGVAYVATSLNSKREIEHLGTLDRLVVGARHPSQNLTLTALFDALRQSQGTRDRSENIDQELWNKWVMLAAGAAITCLMRGNVGEVLATRYGHQIMSQAIEECATVAGASGWPLPALVLNQIEARLLDKTSNWAASMMRDMNVGAQRLEAAVIVGDMAKRAHELGLQAVLMEAAYSHLQVYLEQMAASGAAKR